jgi:hypothetical protein
LYSYLVKKCSSMIGRSIDCPSVSRACLLVANPTPLRDVTTNACAVHVMDGWGRWRRHIAGSSRHPAIFAQAVKSRLEMCSDCQILLFHLIASALYFGNPSSLYALRSNVQYLEVACSCRRLPRSDNVHSLCTTCFAKHRATFVETTTFTIRMCMSVVPC